MSQYRKSLIALTTAVIGVGWHFTALAIVERRAPIYPGVDDLVFDWLPQVDLFMVGEIAFALALVAYIVTYFRQPSRDPWHVMTQLGIFYGIRGVFLLLLPIGGPLDAPDHGERWAFYPYGEHAYFPGGHIGIMLIMALSFAKTNARRIAIVVTVIFGIGSMLTRAHYTIDVIAGLMLAYGIVLWTKQSPRFQRVFHRTPPT